MIVRLARALDTTPIMLCVTMSPCASVCASSAFAVRSMRYFCATPASLVRFLYVTCAFYAFVIRLMCAGIYIISSFIVYLAFFVRFSSVTRSLLVRWSNAMCVEKY